MPPDQELATRLLVGRVDMRPRTRTLQEECMKSKFFQSTSIKEPEMNKVLAAMIAALIAAGAYAQNPPGASSQEQVITNSKPQQRAQAKDKAKSQKEVGNTGG